MKVQAKVRVFAVLMIALSWGLGRFVHPAWLWLSVLVGLNVLQSAFTNFCPATTFFRAISRKKA